MNPPQWYRHMPLSATVCDARGIIIDMNEAACAQFAKYGGAALIGTSLLDCHPEPSRTQLARMLAEQTPNTCTTEKAGVKRLVHQTPWYEDGAFAGFIEVSFEIPAALPHHRRD